MVHWDCGFFISDFTGIIYNIAAKKWPIISAAVFLVLSICIYRYASHWPVHGFWFCLVRLPEFYLGILLHMYRKKVDRYERRLVWGCFFLMVAVGIIDMDSVFLSIYSRPIYPSETKVVLVYDSYDRGYISWLPILESSILITYDQ